MPNQKLFYFQEIFFYILRHLEFFFKLFYEVAPTIHLKFKLDYAQRSVVIVFVPTIENAVEAFSNAEDLPSEGDGSPPLIHVANTAPYHRPV